MKNLLRIGKVMGRFPSSPMAWVTFPEHQVFRLASAFAFVEDLFNLIFVVALGHDRWGPFRNPLRLVWRLVRLQGTHVKNVVRLDRRW